MKKQIRADNIFEILSADNQNPTTELLYKNDFTFLLAVILSAQSTDRSINLVTKSLFTNYYTPEKIVLLGVEGLKEYIKSIGLFNNKAKNIIALCRVLIQDYGSRIPNNFESLITLPGVGRKTANVVLNCIFKQPTIAVDTHVFRVAKRVGLAQGKRPEKVEAELIEVIDPKWLKHAHHWLVLHGRYICKARKPNCMVCPIKAYCSYYQESLSRS